MYLSFTVYDVHIFSHSLKANPRLLLKWQNSHWTRASSISRLHDHTQKHTLGRTPPDEWPPRSRDLYVTTHNTHKSQTKLTPAGFEPSTPASEVQQTHCQDLLLSLLPLLNYFKNKIVFLNNEGWMKVSVEISDVASSPGPCHYFLQRVP